MTDQETYAYAILLLEKLGKKITVANVTKIISALGAETDRRLIELTIQAHHGHPKKLGDKGTPSPAATTPKIYRGGGGDDRDAPVAGAATIQKKSTGLPKVI